MKGNKDEGFALTENLHEQNKIFDPETERLDKINESLTLIQRLAGLTFGTDAYLLAAFAKKIPSGQAADLGAGTGVISLLCAARKKYSHIYSVELQKEYASLCERNIALNSLSDMISVINSDVREIRSCDTEGELAAVLTNPPYMRASSGRENPSAEKNIARREVYGTISDFCAAAARLLKSGGMFYAVYRPERLAELICAMRDVRIEPKRLVFVYPDVCSPPSLILVEGRRDGAPSVKISRPLIIYKGGTREYTDDMERIYTEFSLEHLF